MLELDSLYGNIPSVVCATFKFRSDVVNSPSSSFNLG